MEGTKTLGSVPCNKAGYGCGLSVGVSVCKQL